MGAVRLRMDGFLALDDEEFDWGMRMNFFPALRASRAVVPAMLEQGGGAIVNVASVNAFCQPDGATIDYGAAKAAVVNLTKSLAQELGPQGIRVNAISPGPVATDLWLGEGGAADTDRGGDRRRGDRRARAGARRASPRGASRAPTRSPRSRSCSPRTGSAT